MTEKGFERQMQIYLDNNSLGKLALELCGASFDDSLQKAREKIAALLGAKSSEEIIFTSSGSESNRVAILSFIKAASQKKHIVATPIEHNSVRRILGFLSKKGFDISFVEISSEGLIDIERLKKSLRKDTLLVLIIAADAETGITLPVNEIASVVKNYSDAFFYTDAAMALGKIPFAVKDAQIDALGVSGHKIHGPKGIGALYVRKDLLKFFRKVKFSSVKASAFGKAAELSMDFSQVEKIKKMRDELEKQIAEKLPEAKILFRKSARLPNTSVICFPSMNGELIISKLSKYGIVTSTSAVCYLKEHKPSPSFLAMNVAYSDVIGSVRFSLSRYNTEEEIMFVVEKLGEAIKELKVVSGTV